MEATLAQIAKILLDASTVGIISHRRPDGDAIGSSLAMASVLEALGKTVTVVIDDGVPEILAFLPDSERVKRPVDFPEPVVVEVLLVLDCAGEDRPGEAPWATFSGWRTCVNLDHHISNTGFGDLCHVETESPATGQIVFDLVGEMGCELTPSARDNLFAAISSDTGSFRYPGATAKTYRIGAELIERGADVGYLSQRLYENYSLRRILVMRELLKTMELRCDNRIVFVRLTIDIIEKTGCQAGDTEGIIDVIRSIDSVIVAVFFEELHDGRVRVSSRSKSRAVDVGEICGQFGGGGHHLAAGTRLRGPLDEAVARFIKAVEDRIHGND
ncbi:MAG: DHH family phosphoesterase [Verrucomicrobiae bacterium]|nr:DHH family phosphoesterase [Verrucomicrobiae bacterium]MCP5539741.1 DHH family phosphoesterase [Akkermansiaceae bacterium]